MARPASRPKRYGYATEISRLPSLSCRTLSPGVIAKQPVWLVFVSRHGGHQRHPLAAYAAIDETPAAREVSPGVVQLSLGKIQFFHMKEDRVWRSRYDAMPIDIFFQAVRSDDRGTRCHADQRSTGIR